MKHRIEELEVKGVVDKSGFICTYKPGHSRGDLYIDQILYGGKIFRDQVTIDRFLGLLKDRVAFEVHNRLFPEDPWYRKEKTLTVAYSVGGGELKYLNAKEWDTVSFDY